MRKGFKWEPAQLIRGKDNLIASTQFKNIKAFIPTYESDRHVNMNFIMGWEYGRIWMDERNKWEKLMYTVSDEPAKGSLPYQRKYVLRVIKKKK